LLLAIYFLVYLDFFILNQNKPFMQQPQAVSCASCGERVCTFSHNPEAAPQRASQAKGREAGSRWLGVWGQPKAVPLREVSKSADNSLYNNDLSGDKAL
jgi:tRNA(Phe) wybutosine-synthesizing methylase Tyw3